MRSIIVVAQVARNLWLLVNKPHLWATFGLGLFTAINVLTNH